MDLSGENQQEALKVMVDRLMARLRTAIPGVVKSFDAENQLFTIEPAIKKIQTIDGEQKFLDIPPIIRVPATLASYAQTIGFSITMPYQAGDEVLLILADRSIDNFVDNGGKQRPVETVVPRHHHITDGIAVVGIVSGKYIIPDYSLDSTDIRNRDRTTRISQFEEKIEHERIGGSQTAFYRLKEDEIYSWVYDQSSPEEGHVTIRKDEINAQVTNDPDDAFVNIKSTEVIAEITDGSSTSNVNMQPALIDADTTDGSSTATINMTPSQIDSTVEGAASTSQVFMDDSHVKTEVVGAAGTGTALVKSDEISLDLNSAPFTYQVNMSGGVINIEVGGIFACSINLDSNTGILDISADLYIVLNGIIWDTHKHIGVTPGNQLTGIPV